MPLHRREWSEDALDLLKKRYLLSNNYSVNGWINRVCDHLSQNASPALKQAKKKKYFDLLESRAFLPTSAALYNSLNGKGSLAGCIVLPLSENSKEIIQKSIPEMAEVLFAGIGVGIDLTVIPPRLTEDNLTRRACPGPVEMLKAITKSVEAAMNYGGVKRSAFMAALNCQHPDIFEFIALKRHHRMPNVNTSVSFNNELYIALENQQMLPVLFKNRQLTTEDMTQMKKQASARSLPEHDLVVSDDKEVFSRAAETAVGKVIDGSIYFDPEKIITFISENAHACGDPGLINLDAINRDNPTHPLHAEELVTGVGEITITTPCGEQPLLPYEVCHLGSVNLSVFAANKHFDWNLFQETLKTAVELMDDLIDVGDNVLLEANVIAQANRKIGIGLMGLADVLAELEMPYDSPEAIAFIDELGMTLEKTTRIESEKLAGERGVFPNWRNSKFSYPRRHATLTTIAPTGHISTLADCSTSIEPYFLVSYGRDAAGKRRYTSRVLVEKLAQMDYSLEEWIQDTKKSYPSFQFDGTLYGLNPDATPDLVKNARLKELKNIFRTSHEIHPSAHIEVVRVLQRYIENGVSKTINLPRQATIDDVKNTYLQAIEYRLKGITIFRDGSLEEQALYALEACPSCQATQFLMPSDCAGWKCDPVIGGCGWELCAI
jgi:ribonucleoside-diphosphate reductase alpha chain